jgi:hypothetical protein
MMRSFARFAALSLALAPLAAQAAEPPCLTPAEFTALSTYALPSIITGTSDRCSASLPADAWLKRNGSQLAARYAVAKPGAWPAAKAAFFKFSAGSANAEATNMLKTLPDSSLQPMLDALISGMVGQQVPTERCTAINRLVQLVSPLPPENTAELIAFAAGLGAKSGRGKLGSFSLCPV